MAGYPVRQTTESALHFTSWEMFILTQIRLLWEAFSQAEMTAWNYSLTYLHHCL